MLPNLKISP